MNEEENKKEKKENEYGFFKNLKNDLKNDSFYKRVFFLAIVIVVVYFIISPLNNCLRSGKSYSSCGSDRWTGLKW